MLQVMSTNKPVDDSYRMSQGQCILSYSNFLCLVEKSCYYVSLSFSIKIGRESIKAFVNVTEIKHVLGYVRVILVLVCLLSSEFHSSDTHLVRKLTIYLVEWLI